MKKILAIFRSNLKNLEYYHECNDFTVFKEICHDFYLNQGIWYLENNYFDEVVVWRLFDSKKDDIVFDINGKKFIQRWVKNLNQVFNYDRPTVSFFRGGFKEYDEITKINHKFFNTKLYLAAGKRIFPQYGGIYNRILVEDEKDFANNRCIPFFKTTNSNIFKKLNLNKEWDLCIISNFTQLKYKGTDIIFDKISNNKFLKSLKICHIGNNDNIGKSICNKLGINNVEFLGYKKRIEINDILNRSKFGIVNSNRTDGCPRVITEILTSGTPLLINEETRVLSYYKKYGVINFNNNNICERIKFGLENYNKLYNELNDNLYMFDIEKMCKMNYELWKI